MVMSEGLGSAERDAVLVAAVRSGDLDAFGELFERHYPSLVRILIHQGADPELAQDLIQETFLVAYQKLGQLRDDERFWAWLYQIARNMLFKTWRRKRLYRLISLEHVAGVREVRQRIAYDAVEIQGYPLRESVRSVLDELSYKYREALILHYVEGYSAKEIAEIVGISPAAAQRRAHRAKQEFQRRYQVDANREPMVPIPQQTDI